MKIIVGLGNYGKEYEGTRHNAGYITIDKLVENLNWTIDKKFEAEVIKGEGMILVKPLTYMNESGRAVRKIMDFYKLEPDDLILIHDDLDLGLGECKVVKGVGPKIHNGVNSVEKYMGQKNFWRVRIGVDNRKITGYVGSGADYVLEKFRSEEKAILNQVIEKAILELKIIFKKNDKSI